LQFWYSTVHKAKSNLVSSAAAQHVGLLLFEGFSNLCLANAVEPLRAANSLSGRPLYRWHFLGLSDRVVLSSSGVPVQPQKMGPEQRGDLLLVMPSYGFRDLATPECLRALRAARTRYGVLAGLDTGSWLLAAAGVLDGYRATSHWDVLEALAERFPEVDVTQDRYVWDRDRASSGGAMTTLELMLAMIERDHGATLALEVAALFMFGEQPVGGAPLPGLPDDKVVRAAAALMRRNVEAPLPIARIARGVGLGQRALEQLFRRKTGHSPAQIYRSIRLAEARRRLESTRDPVAEIAGRCGYADATAMARAFKAEFGLSPTALRRAAR
jgi:transcriptional regulator GlxA family with amidase domain